jgi:hypothetical protein
MLMPILLQRLRPYKSCSRKSVRVLTLQLYMPYNNVTTCDPRITLLAEQTSLASITAAMLLAATIPVCTACDNASYDQNIMILQQNHTSRTAVEQQQPVISHRIMCSSTAAACVSSCAAQRVHEVAIDVLTARAASRPGT